MLFSICLLLLYAISCRAYSRHVVPYNIQDCTKDQATTIAEGLDEAIRMLQATNERLSDLYRWFAQNPPTPLNQANNYDEMSVYRTWQTLYERPLQNMTVFYSDPHRNALERIGNIMNLTQIMANSINGSVSDVSHPLQIYCGTSWMRRTSGDRYPSELQGVLFDSRPDNMIHENEQKDRKWLKMPGMNGSFEEELAEGSQTLPPFVAFDDMAGPYKTVLAVNKQYFPIVWNASANPQGVLYDDLINNDKTPDNSTYHLKDLVNNHISAQLIQILSTLPGITGENNQRQYTPICKLPNESDPPPEHEDKPNPAVFGWYCAEWLGKTSPEMAEKSAQNFMFLNIALYLRNRDWSKGLSRPPTDAQMS